MIRQCFIENTNIEQFIGTSVQNFILKHHNNERRNVQLVQRFQNNNTKIQKDQSTEAKTFGTLRYKIVSIENLSGVH